MATPLDLLEKIQTASATDAWRAIFEYALAICSAPLQVSSASQQVTSRDKELANLDLILSSSGWELWTEFEGNVERTADALANWWASQTGDRSILILDGLSLREVPWLIQGANERGYQVKVRATGAELPANTTPFAKALGFGQRSDLENNQASQTHRLKGAFTDCVNLPWIDCANQINFEPNWVLWHHWPDCQIHDLAAPGKGVSALAMEAANQLTSDDFWILIDRLTQQRNLVITSDHGYAASGLFSDASEEQAKYLKNTFKGQRCTDDLQTESAWIPPVDVVVSSQHGQKRYVLGRRKWKNAGGYPTLTHGGLSVLEVASPFIEISKIEEH